MSGWDFKINPCSKQEIIEECIKSICSMTCLKHSVLGNELWTVWEKKDGTRIILLFLLSSRNKCWGYKEISESSGPFYYKCPLAFLDLVPVANANWRAGVIAYHERRLNNHKAVQNTQAGKIVALDVPDNEFRVTCLKPFLGVNIKNKRLYRLVKSRVIVVRDESSPVNEQRVE